MTIESLKLSLFYKTQFDKKNKCDNMQRKVSPTTLVQQLSHIFGFNPQF